MGNNILLGSSFTGWIADTTSKDIVGVVNNNSNEATFCSPGLYNWAVPTGVTSINAILIGAGANGNGSTLGGAGGELSYFNNLSVTPNTTVKVLVGGGNDTAVEPSAIFDKSVAVTNANYSVITPGSTNAASWTPSINTSFSYSAIVIGGGGGGGSIYGASGGGGGGAAYINNFYPFSIPGAYTLTAGSGGGAGVAGGTSSISNGGTVIIQATGGAGGIGGKAQTGGAGGTGTVTAGYGTGGTYTGGKGGDTTGSSGGGGGGGAAGPGGNGGAGGAAGADLGGSGTGGTSATANTGAGGGGGGGAGLGTTTSYYVGGGAGGAGSILLFGGTSTSPGGSGGTYSTSSAGVQGGKTGTPTGSTGSAGTAGGAYTSGNAGTNGNGGNGGGLGGGGGGAGGVSSSTFPGGSGSGGGVIVIWPGVTRTFPSTNIATYTTTTYWITVNSSTALNLVAGMPIYFDQSIGPLSANTVYTVTSASANFSNASTFYYFQIADSRGRTNTLPAATGVSTANVNIYYPSNIARGGGSTFPSIRTTAGASGAAGGTTTAAGGGGAGGYTGAGGNSGVAGSGGGGGGGNSTGTTGGGGVGLYGTSASPSNGAIGGGGGSGGYSAKSINGALFGGGGGATGIGANGAVRIIWGSNTYPLSAATADTSVPSGTVTIASILNGIPALASKSAIASSSNISNGIVTLNSNPTSAGQALFTIGAPTATIDTLNLNTTSGGFNNTPLGITGPTGSNLISVPPKPTNYTYVNTLSITGPTGLIFSPRTSNYNVVELDVPGKDLSSELTLITQPRSDSGGAARKTDQNLSTQDDVLNKTGWIGGTST
jgi:hypothetical protein